ncbi:MAG: glycoside hydrolase family 9 protein [Prevotella sp.]|nr:glycoside hydrolase family 9 protein [Prevotella sp.]
MRLVTTMLLCACTLVAAAQDVNPIKVNQAGYYPGGHKSAVVEQDGISDLFTLTDISNGKEVWSAQLSVITASPLSKKLRATLDFSEVDRTGAFILSNGVDEQIVTIKDHAFADLAAAAMKAFYLMRSGEEILEEYAGVYARPLAHKDDSVLVHASAATAERPEGTVISSPGGWYDAGDYNKYIVNSAFSIGLMLCAYEMNPDYFNAMNTNIPESDNATPDFLDEIMVNLKWMQTMQDLDGGVYHKLTTPNFEGFVMPKDCHQPRYVVKKTTTAALDFAAVMAQASRIYKAFDEFKDWSDEALAQAEKAYAWAKANPGIFYHQDEMNALFDPDINTGTYDDIDTSDEFLWAAAELFRATGKSEYDTFAASAPAEFVIPTWDKVAGLAVYTMIASGDSIICKPLITNYLAPYMASVKGSSFDSPYGNRADDFCWGSNAERCCGLGIALLYAYRLTSDAAYLDGALRTADYLLGKNATGYCYVTGFGTHSPKHPHHRLSAADDIDEPLPGLLVGGPNPGMQDRDGCDSYTSDLPDEAYTDDVASYASNEIAINWNASLVALAAWIDAEMK